MRRPNLAGLFAVLALLVTSATTSGATNSPEYVVTVGDQRLRFVSRPESGYVVKSAEAKTAPGVLGGALSAFGATDVKVASGLKRRGIRVVETRRTASDSERTMAQLRNQGQVEYAAPLFSSNGETVAIIPEVIVQVTAQTDAAKLRPAPCTWAFILPPGVYFVSPDRLDAKRYRPSAARPIATRSSVSMLPAN